MVIKLLIIALEPHLIPYFMANEIWYALVFHICDFDYHASCVPRKRVEGHIIIAYCWPLTYSNNCHIKHGYRDHKYEIRMHTIVH